MKLRVASALHTPFSIRVCTLLITTMALLVTTVPAQTAKRGSSKAGQARGTPAKPNSLTICQGVPVPKGYVIVAYITSSACPHGAYVIKKQDAYSESVAAAYSKPKAPATTAAPPASTTPSADANGSAQSPTDLSDSDLPVTDDPFASAPPVSTTNTQPGNSAPQVRATVDPAPASAGAGSRPRRVANASSSQPNAASIVVADDEPDRPARPPQWAGNAPLKSPVAAATGAVSDAGPEEVAEGDVIRVDTSFVSVPVSVLDRHGRFIPDLKREDFTIFENGVQQSLAHFEPADKPFTVALLLDTSPSTQFHLWQIKEAAVAFAKQLRPQDRVLVVSFNDQVLLLTEVTNDLNVISSVIETHANMGTATRVYDAVHLVIKERLNKIKGRKAIVLFTDGVDTASNRASYQSNIRDAEELDALIYPVQYDTSSDVNAGAGSGGGRT